MVRKNSFVLNTTERLVESARRLSFLLVLVLSIASEAVASEPTSFEFKAHSAWVKAINFSVDGKTFLTGGGTNGIDDQLFVWQSDRINPAILNTPWPLGNHQPIRMRFDWPRKVAIAQNSLRDSLYEINLESGKSCNISAVKGRGYGANFTDMYFAYAIDNRVVVSSIADGRILFSEAMGERKQAASLRSIDVTADGAIVVVGERGSGMGQNPPIKLIDVKSKKEVVRIFPDESIEDVRFSPSDELVLAANAGRGFIWRRDGEKVSDFPVFGARFLIYELSPNEYLIATTTANGTSLVELLSGQTVWSSNGPANADDLNTSLAFSRDGKCLAIGRWSGAVHVVQLVSTKPALARSLDLIWSELASEDAAKAVRAVWEFSSRGKEAIEFLIKKFPADQPAALTERQLELLIEELESDIAETREEAANELAQAGELAHSALERALKGAIATESTITIRRLLAKLKLRYLPKSHSDLVKSRVIWTLENIGRDSIPALEKIGKSSDRWAATLAINAKHRLLR